MKPPKPKISIGDLTLYMPMLEELYGPSQTDELLSFQLNAIADLIQIEYVVTA